jgi:hypothetical protein
MSAWSSFAGWRSSRSSTGAEPRTNQGRVRERSGGTSASPPPHPPPAPQPLLQQQQLSPSQRRIPHRQPRPPAPPASQNPSPANTSSAYPHRGTGCAFGIRHVVDGTEPRRLMRPSRRELARQRRESPREPDRLVTRREAADILGISLDSRPALALLPRPFAYVIIGVRECRHCDHAGRWRQSTGDRLGTAPGGARPSGAELRAGCTPPGAGCGGLLYGTNRPPETQGVPRPASGV